jgi:hypothetical protein
MPGGKGGPGEGMGHGFLRSKAEKRGINGFIVFITELLPVSRRKNVVSGCWRRRSRKSVGMTGEHDHVARSQVTKQAYSLHLRRGWEWLFVSSIRWYRPVCYARVPSCHPYFTIYPDNISHGGWSRRYCNLGKEKQYTLERTWSFFVPGFLLARKSLMHNTSFLWA